MAHAQHRTLAHHVDREVTAFRDRYIHFPQVADHGRFKRIPLGFVCQVMEEKCVYARSERAKGYGTAPRRSTRLSQRPHISDNSTTIS